MIVDWRAHKYLGEFQYALGRNLRRIPQPYKVRSMLWQEKTAQPPRIQTWSIEPPVEYPRNPRKNHGSIDGLCGSMREFGFKIPCLVRSYGLSVEPHIKAFQESSGLSRQESIHSNRDLSKG
jgi:hypothetical protein